ncbi:hypothetical protein CCFV1_ORF066 [Cotesia congregata filamentous virus 1]|uniref:Uncharacterized protein n=1 Tax=Cotesia congregata filamentous virus 1 TaxID=3064291 RepID=A0ABC8QJP0_9VIRU|nr:hypothetical protein CCFV1_ORF066 [Cotesia congregata filamentous virus 1]
MVLTFVDHLYPIVERVHSITYKPIVLDGQVVLEINSLYNKILWQTLIYNRVSFYTNNLKVPLFILKNILSNIRDTQKFYINSRGDLIKLPWGLNELEKQ